MSSAAPNPALELDPFTAKAENDNITPQDKITDLHRIVKEAKTAMLTTRDSAGNLHSRAMHPSSRHSSTQLNLIFLANNVSHKFEEIKNDSNVNVSFCDPSSTNWASYSGTAKVSQDKDLIKQHWSHSVSAYFGDLKDGTHKGDENDPRVSIIEVIPNEIRYWVATQGTLMRGVNVAISAATGKVAAPGELRTISKDEIQLTHSLHSK